MLRSMCRSCIAQLLSTVRTVLRSPWWFATLLFCILCIVPPPLTICCRCDSRNYISLPAMLIQFVASPACWSVTLHRPQAACCSCCCRIYVTQWELMTMSEMWRSGNWCVGLRWNYVNTTRSVGSPECVGDTCRKRRTNKGKLPRNFGP